MPKKKADNPEPRRIPTELELLEYANVPVKIAAAYLGISEQAIRWGIRSEGKNHLPIGTPSRSRCIIPPQKLIAYKKGLDEQERISVEVKVIAKFLENKTLDFDEVLELVAKKMRQKPEAVSYTY